MGVWQCATTTLQSHHASRSIRNPRIGTPRRHRARRRGPRHHLAASAPPTVGGPGTDERGTIQQGYIELSNVQVVEEMVNLIAAQPAYEVNSKTVQTSDEMLQISNNLKR